MLFRLRLNILIFLLIVFRLTTFLLIFLAYRVWDFCFGMHLVTGCCLNKVILELTYRQLKLMSHIPFVQKCTYSLCCLEKIRILYGLFKNILLYCFTSGSYYIHFQPRYSRYSYKTDCILVLSVRISCWVHWCKNIYKMWNFFCRCSIFVFCLLSFLHCFYVALT